jgi:hypothetical protein
MSSFWIDRVKNGAIYVTVSVLIVGALGYLMLRRTNVQKTTVESGGVVNNYDWWKDAQITVLPFGCAPIKAERPGKIK